MMTENAPTLRSDDELLHLRDRLLPEILSQFVTFDFNPYAGGEFLEVAQEVIAGQLSEWTCAR